MASMTSPRTHRFVSVDVLTTSYRIVGKTMISNTGTIGMINNPNSSFMEIHDARLARIHMPTKLADHFETIRLSKERLCAISVSRVEDLGPQSIARAGYAQTRRHACFLTAQNYEMEGEIEWQGRFDFSLLMKEGTSNFIALYDANITGILIPTLKIETPAALFNRNQVDLFGLLKQRQSE